MVIDAVDTAEKINAFVPVVAKILGNHGLMITSEVKVVHQGVLLPRS